MTYERWQDLIAKLKERFTEVKTGRQDIAEEGGGQMEFAELNSPHGAVRFELLIRPKVIGKKTIYSKRIGSSTTVEYQYDDSEHTLTLKVLLNQGQGDDWQELSLAEVAEMGLLN